MTQLLCHLFGDYVIQNHWMAQNKVRAWFPACVHVATYMLPFLVLRPSIAAFSAMAATHLLIDRFRLAKYWVDFWGVGNSGRLWGAKIDPAPDWLAVWLLIIVDNTFHLTINWACLEWL